MLNPDVVGLIPAGGQAARIAPLPCSKELFPVGFRVTEAGKSTRPKVVCHYLLEKMRLAGVKKTYIVLREGKWDIPTYLGDGSLLDMHFAYLMMGVPFGTPYTVDQAYPFIKDAVVAFGFPDILFDPEDAYTSLLKRQTATKADVVLGAYPAHDSRIMDMIDVDSNGRVQSIHIKPGATALRYAWICAVWSPSFTGFQHKFLQGLRGSDSHRGGSPQEELSVGHVLRAAVTQGLRTEAVVFEGHSYLDIGTPEGLRKAVEDAGMLHRYGSHPQSSAPRSVVQAPETPAPRGSSKHP